MWACCANSLAVGSKYPEGGRASDGRGEADRASLQLPTAYCLLPTLLMNARPLKLALVTRRYPPLIGGAEKVLSYLAGALAAEGADVTVLTSQMPGLNLSAEEEVPITPSTKTTSKRSVSSARLRIVRLETSKLRFWGTWCYMQNLGRWFQQHPVDLAYVSMLKHDAYSVIGAGGRSGFSVVLRPEGAGVTGDVAWQSWGNLGRKIGRRCRRATAFVAISKAIEHELRESWHSGTMRPSRWTEMIRPTPEEPRIVAIPNGVPVPSEAWQRRPDWRQRRERSLSAGWHRKRDWTRWSKHGLWCEPGTRTHD